MSNTEIGKPQYGNSTNTRPNADNANWKLDTEGSHHYRILPPFGELASSGKWFGYEALHWGFKLSTGKKRAFRCIQRKNRKTKMVEVECPMCNEIAKYREQLETKREALKKEKKTSEEVNTILSPLEGWLENYNLQKGFFLNVMRPDGQIGRLFLKIRCKGALDIAISKLISGEHVDPIDADQGVWMDFQRTGMTRNNTVYTVEPVMENVEINGRKMKTLKLAPLSQDILDRMKKEAFDLSGYYKDLSFNEVQMLVSSGGDSSVVDSVFGAPAVSASPTTEDDDSTPPWEETTESQKVAAEPSAADAAINDEEAAVLAQLAQLRAKKAGAKAPANSDSFLEAFKAGKL